jgi:hypothetical protein
MGWQTFCTTEETALPKIKIEHDANIVFDSQGIVHEAFAQEDCTVHAEYYNGVLDRLISRIRRVRPSL